MRAATILIKDRGMIARKRPERASGRLSSLTPGLLEFVSYLQANTRDTPRGQIAGDEPEIGGDLATAILSHELRSKCERSQARKMSAGENWVFHILTAS